MKRFLGALLAATLAVRGLPATAQDFTVEEVPSASASNLTQVKPRTILLSDGRKDPLADPVTGLMRFEDWSRAKPAQKELLSLHPGYVEPTITVSVHGVEKPYKEKLHVYVAEARFVLSKPPTAIDLARFTTLPFLERVDPSIKHRAIAPGDVMPLRDPDSRHNLRPDRAWCEARKDSICIESRYQLEGKLPLGIRLANKLDEGAKKIAEHIEFQSELRLLSPSEIEKAGLPRLTGLSTPVAGALEQSLFHVNQMMQFGKFLAVFQRHPADPDKTVVTAFMTLAVESDVLEKKKEYERVPVLRNLVPAQVLVGASSFNTGSSISAGLPEYTRNRLKAIAGFLERG